MSLRRIVKSSFLADFPYISEKDDAIDRGSDAWNHLRYLETRDEAHVPLLPGAEPVRFVLRLLTRGERQRLQGLLVGECNAIACALALRSATGPALVVEKDGAEVEVKIQHTDGVVTDETMEALGHDLIQEIGTVVLRMATLSESFRQRDRVRGVGVG